MREHRHGDMGGLPGWVKLVWLFIFLALAAFHVRRSLGERHSGDPARFISEATRAGMGAAGMAMMLIVMV